VDLNSIGVFRTASERMNWLSKRQQVISENIANADTPGYKAKEIEPFDVQLSRARGLRTTHEKHISTGRGGDYAVREATDHWGESPNGNTVSLEQQTIKSSETAEDYQAATNVYKKSLQLMKMAASGGN
jgi:flagellar basal-body rod protein FlgB